MDIQTDVSVHESITLDQAISLANKYEQKSLVSKEPINKFPYSKQPPLLPSPSVSKPPLLPTPPSRLALPLPPPSTSNPSFSTSTFLVKRLSPAEIQQRREKGLCFSCDGIYSPGHKCEPFPHLLIITDETSDLVNFSDSFVLDDILAEELQCLEVQSHSAISYCALPHPNKTTQGSIYVNPQWNKIEIPLYLEDPSLNIITMKKKSSSTDTALCRKAG